MIRLLAALLIVSSAALIVGGCGSDSNPKVETVSGSQAQETLKGMRKPMAAGGQQQSTGTSLTD